MANMGLKLFQDVIAGSASDKATRVNFFLQTTEIRCYQCSCCRNYFEYRVEKGHIGSSISEAVGSYQNQKK